MRFSLRFLLIILLYTYIWSTYANATPADKKDSVLTNIKVHADLPLIEKDHKLFQELKYASTTKQELSVTCVCYTYDCKGDSTLIYSIRNRPCVFEKGTSILKLPFSQYNDRNNYLLDNFYKSFVGLNAIPFGQYKLFISFQSKDSQCYSYVYAYAIDSTLVPYSSIKRTIDRVINANITPSINNNTLSQFSVVATKPSKVLARLSRKLDHALAQKGFELKQETDALRNYLSIYFNAKFVGRYVIAENTPILEQVSVRQNSVKQNIASLSNLDFLQSNTLLSQMKTMLDGSKDPIELMGTLSVTSSFASAQPEYANLDNNYYELRGDLATKLFSIPVSLEAYYTSQDQNRRLKSSFLRLHYDVSKYRSSMQTAINGFKQQFDQLEAKGKGMEMLYDNSINQLQRQKSNLIAIVQQQSGVPFSNFASSSQEEVKQQIEAYLMRKLTDTLTTLKQTANKKLDSVASQSNLIAHSKTFADSVEHIYQHLMHRYKEIQALEIKINKYSKLIAQYKNAHYFDSSLGYSQIQNLLQENNPRKWFNASQHFMPKNKSMQFLSRLINFDIGVINSYASKYTMAGQQLRGVDMAYDIGVCKLGISIGNTAFVGRDGVQDKYFTYMVKSAFALSKNQQAQLVYYSYIPSLQQELNMPFYKNIEFTLPSFKNPVHILSSNYEGMLFGAITIRGELASSRFSGQDWMTNFQSTKLAWNISLEGQLPHTPLQFKTLVEHGGIDFNNATLPINISGTDRYQCALRGTFLKSFLTASIDFNRLQQQNFSYAGGNNKWGFELATHSKQYPSISLGYKPYATFRSYADTFLIPQRPIVGAVSTGKLSYQLKRAGSVWRFMAMYNKSVSIIDTISYAAQISQGVVAYASKIWQASLSIGATSIDNATQLTVAHQQTKFFSLLLSKQLNPHVFVSGGLDVAYAAFGLTKYGMSASINYTTSRLPVLIRVAARNMTYKLLADDAWKKLYSGSVEFVWKLKMKLT